MIKKLEDKKIEILEEIKKLDEKIEEVNKNIEEVTDSLNSEIDKLNKLENKKKLLDGEIQNLITADTVIKNLDIDLEVDIEPPETEITTIEEWVQPQGAHDAYNKGDTVLYEGKYYTSLIDGNVWSPIAYPQGWTEIII